MELPKKPGGIVGVLILGVVGLAIAVVTIKAAIDLTRPDPLVQQAQQEVERIRQQ